MPSRADRVGLERALRIGAAIALAWLIVGLFRERRTTGGEIIESRNLAAQLGRWTATPPADSLGLRLTGAPDRVARAYLRAFTANGTSIAWENRGISPLMLDGESLQDPAGGAVLRLTGEANSSIAVSDALGLLDSVRISGLGVTARLSAASGTIRALTGSTLATAHLPPASSDRSIVVLGMGGWESKFTIQALEERGWNVESRLALAPRLATGQGRPFPLDTTRQLAVVVLDSSALTYAREIVQFVRSGGGLVLGASASPSALRVFPVGATDLEISNGSPLLTAWRLGSGRVIQSRHSDTWRRRMQEGDNAVAEHRAWWAGLVSAVAYRPALLHSGAANPAPLVALIQELGPPGPLPSESRSRSFWPAALAVLLTALFGEWFSRRLRGAA
jgi:hypothetical protein